MTDFFYSVITTGMQVTPYIKLLSRMCVGCYILVIFLSLYVVTAGKKLYHRLHAESYSSRLSIKSKGAGLS